MENQLKTKGGGDNNIHSWEIELKGPVSKEQNILLNKIFKERRKKQWAEQHGIKWMDGMPLTLKQIRSFYDSENLEEMLNDLAQKGYLKVEHPKALFEEVTIFGTKTTRVENKNLEPGYNIVTGKLSFEINKILGPNCIAPTLVATDMARLAVVDGQGLRKMTLREGMRLFGYPEAFEMPVSEKDGFDLLGNTVAVSVVSAIAERMAEQYHLHHLTSSSTFYAPITKARFHASSLAN